MEERRSKGTYVRQINFRDSREKNLGPENSAFKAICGLEKNLDR